MNIAVALPDQARARLALAVQLSAEGNVDGARAALSEVEMAYPGAVELGTVRGVLALNNAVRMSQEGRVDEAEALLREALFHAPLENARSALRVLLLHRAQQQALAGDWRGATPPFREVLRLGADRLQLGALGEKLSQPHLQTALALVNKDILGATDHALAAWHLHASRDTYDTAWKLCGSVGAGFIGAVFAEASLKEKVNDSFESYGAWIAYGNVLRRAGRRNAAEVAYRRAMALWPQAPFAATRLASLLADSRRFREADRIFTRIAREFGGRERIIRLDAGFMDELRGQALPEAASSLAADQSDFGERPPWVILAGCDGGYFERFAAKLVASVRQHCGVDGIVHLHVVNPGPDHVRSFLALQRDMAPLRLRWTTEMIDIAQFGENRNTYYACARFLQLPHLIRRYNCPLLMLDVDSIVLRDLRPLLDQVETEGCDIGMIVGEPGEVWGTYWADHVAILPTPLALEFFTLAAKYIRHFFNNGVNDWFLDQVAIFAALQLGFVGRPEPRYLFWPRDLQNSGPESYVWSMHFSQPSNRQAIEKPTNGAPKPT
jgi:tetratricopeptide (TPR) repeat protein